MPAMGDPRFAQSVIYLCAHTSDGAMGIVVNRPLQKPSFGDLLRQLEVAPMPPAREIQLCQGGPVDNARGFVLHTTDWTGEGSLKVTESTALTASLDVLKAIAEGGGPREGLLALGYAGWGPGQLDNEIQQNAWLSVPADDTLVFDSEHDTKWRRALGQAEDRPAATVGRRRPRVDGHVGGRRSAFRAAHEIRVSPNAECAALFRPTFAASPFARRFQPRRR